MVRAGVYANDWGGRDFIGGVNFGEGVASLYPSYEIQSSA
jgi:hypothetical protein